VKAWIATEKGLSFIDLWDAMLTKDGQPREDIWVADRVPNHENYLIRVRLDAVLDRQTGSERLGVNRAGTTPARPRRRAAASAGRTSRSAVPAA
jgi:hypothetical protein